MPGLAEALEEGDAAPARLRDAAADAELARGEAELRREALGLRRPGHRSRSAPPTTARSPPRCRSPPPSAPTPPSIDERAWRLVAAAVGALRRPPTLPPLTGARRTSRSRPAQPPTARSSLTLGDPATPSSPQLAVRRGARARRPPARPRARAPAGVIDADGRQASRSAPAHPLKVAEAVARLGGDPAEPGRGRSRTLVLALLEPAARRRAPARRPRPRPARRAADPPAARRHGQVGRLPHRLRPPRARLRGQRARARRRGRRGAARRRAARREAERRPAPRVPQPAPGGRRSGG